MKTLTNGVEIKEWLHASKDLRILAYIEYICLDKLTEGLSADDLVSKTLHNRRDALRELAKY